MKHADKTKVQKLVDNIQAGEFDENDVDALFMKLRGYSAGNKMLREIGDLIAHNDARNQGVSFERIESTYLFFRFFLEYKQ